MDKTTTEAIAIANNITAQLTLYKNFTNVKVEILDIDRDEMGTIRVMYDIYPYRVKDKPVYFIQTVTPTNKPTEYYPHVFIPTNDDSSDDECIIDEYSKSLMDACVAIVTYDYRETVFNTIVEGEVNESN